MAKRKSGPEQFNDYYAELFKERWEGLSQVLASAHQVVAFVNPALPLQTIGALRETKSLHEYCYSSSAVWPRPEFIEVGQEKLKNYYLLDYASYIAAELIVNSQTDCDYLDLCAAPGGKSLIIASLMSEGSSLICNELSAKRRERLRNVVSEYLPARIKERVKVTGHDAGRWCLYEKEAYDAILLDAPCSSERHLLQKPAHLKDWAVGRTKRLAREQWKLLSSAYLALRPGGKLLYSTCSISPLENDGVVEKLFAKYIDEVRVRELNLAIGESTEYGHMILPDRTGHGPLYISLLEKVKR